MSKLRNTHVFTSESVSEGHPDKVCDQVSDAILDACLAEDAHSRVACETAVTTNFMVNIGEITCSGWDAVDPEAVARQVVKEIGYDREELCFSCDSFDYQCRIHPQSGDISQGVCEGEGLFKEQGAGDQGMMFGYATRSTPSLMPAPIHYSHQLLDHLQRIRKQGDIPYLRPDAKTQVSVLHADGLPTRIANIVISQQTDDIPLEQIRADLLQVARDVLGPTGLLDNDTEFFINPTGKFVIGGPHGDAGLTGRKIIVDTYGGVGCHGGGAFSGKDPSKVDRSAAYYARYAAKNVVAAGLAKECEVMLSYSIGLTKPVGMAVQTFGTGQIPDPEIMDRVKRHFDFRLAGILRNFNSRHLPALNPYGFYQDLAAHGHYGRTDVDLPWEAIDRASELSD